MRGSLDAIERPRKPILDVLPALRYSQLMAGKPSTKTKEAAAREQRLKAALKANLGRRKAQAKARADDGQEANEDSDDG
ncbi:MAG: hypothetical protein HRU30_09285 [Rhodobacteraceae bacterium]|nr:hypothetical protein [Paracoccaceae bacterium]